MQNMGKMMRSTPPPHGSHGGHSNLPPRHQSVAGGGGGSYHGNMYESDGRPVHTSQSHSNNSGPVHHGGSYHQGGPQHQPFQGSSQGRGSGPYFGRSQGPPGGYNNNKTSAQQSDSRLANGDERKVNRDSAYDPKNSHGPSSHSHAPMSSLPQRDHGPKEQRKSYAVIFQTDFDSNLVKTNR